MTIYDKYNLCKEVDKAVFISNITGDIFVFDYRAFMLVYSKKETKYLADYNGIYFFKNLEYVGEL